MQKSILIQKVSRYLQVRYALLIGNLKLIILFYSKLKGKLQSYYIKKPPTQELPQILVTWLCI